MAKMNWSLRDHPAGISAAGGRAWAVHHGGLYPDELNFFNQTITDSMSIRHTQEITCPDCGNIQSSPIWTTVNVTLEPEMREVTMSRRLNVFCCDQCDHMASLDVSVMYHDMTRKYAIQYINLGDMKTQDYYRSIRKNGTMVLPALAAGMMERTGADYLVRPHIVFSMNELVCYILFRDLCEAWGTD